MAKFNGHEFFRACYLKAEPSVDLDKVTSDNPINCSDYKLKMSVYESILHEMGVTDENGKPVDPNSDILLGCNMWMLDMGPSLVDDRKKKSA